ncbi:hypothetical protein V565_199570, partial [Rhizoctonia solani 123E]
MTRLCYCGSGYYCPEHPHIPAFSQQQAASGVPLPASANDMHPNFSLVNSTVSASRPPERVFQDHNLARGSQPSTFASVQQGRNDTSAPTGSQKRSAIGVPTPPASKRLRGLATSANPRALAPLHQIEIARRAAASIPAPYYVDAQTEAAKREQAARAIDCWYLTVGDNHEAEPSEEVKTNLRISDQKRLEAIQLDLRKPQTPRIRCTECLKFGNWRTWKNNHNGGSAYHIREHLVKEHYSAYLAACEQINYTPADRRGSVPLDDEVKEPLTSEGIARYLTKWFAEDDISFNMVSHRGFRRFINYIGQGKVTAKDLPDRHTIAAKAAALSDEAKEHRRQVNRLIAFRVIEGTHAGAHLAETFFEVMEDFGITHKLGWITMDNATNNDSMMVQLEEYMVTQGMDFDRHGNRLRCFPHVVNLAVQDILNALPASAAEYRSALSQQGLKLDDESEAYLSAFLFELLNHIRKTITALRRTQRRQGLRQTIVEGNTDKSWTLKLLELKLDCPTRWSSTRDMIERLLYLYPAVSRYIASDPSLAEYAITHADYEVLHDILTVLSFAHRTQELLSSDKVPTLAFAIPLYYALVEQWGQLQTALPTLSHAIGAGIKKIKLYLDKTRSSPVHIVAMALNPSIGYDWFDQNCSSEEASNARVVVKRH